MGFLSPPRLLGSEQRQEALDLHEDATIAGRCWGAVGQRRRRSEFRHGGPILAAPMGMGTWLCFRVGYWMLQSWLTVVGLMLDFAGFALLLREWWLAFFNEGRQIEAEEQLERMRHLRGLRPPSSGTDPFAALHKIQDDHAVRSARTAHKSAMAARRQAFLTAAVMIAAGFVLQLAGAWPI